MSKPGDPHLSAVLNLLRWDVDQCVMNHFGDRVWLKACLDAGGRRIGITDCCLASDPCDHHRMSTDGPLAPV